MTDNFMKQQTQYMNLSYARGMRHGLRVRYSLVVMAILLVGFACFSAGRAYGYYQTVEQDRALDLPVVAR